MRTRLKFDNDATFDLDEQAANAFGAYATASGWSFRAAIGALIDGTLEGNEMPGTHDLGPGVMGAVSVAKQWTLGDGQWFVAGSATLSAVRASTHETGAADDPSLTAGDLRIGAMAGRAFATIWKPYIMGRAFGGPVAWTIAGESVVGSDTHHYQLGAGLSVATAFGLTLVVDVSALGEQSASLGFGWRL
ncbi:MAG TPA: hypothetical protein VIV11_36005 [Kofleriaceae bacterium]